MPRDQAFIQQANSHVLYKPAIGKLHPTADEARAPGLVLVGDHAPCTQANLTGWLEAVRFLVMPDRNDPSVCIKQA